MTLSKHYEGHGEEVMKSMMKTYKNKKTAKRVFYATENKKKGIKGHMMDMARGGHVHTK